MIGPDDYKRTGSQYSGGSKAATRAANLNDENRHTALTLERVEAICEAVRGGAKPARAAQFCGVTDRTWRRWKERAAAGEEPWRSGVEQVELAEGKFLAEQEAVLAAAGREDWKASAWVLERRLRSEYGAKVEVTSRAAEADPETLTDAELAAIARPQPQLPVPDDSE